ncbi:MAG: class I SAM-dependent methyltransferase [Magnetococcales bacterium]|nr:class I SAM-dependent methyltransferase [Magnetococcales bacterium]
MAASCAPVTPRVLPTPLVSAVRISSDLAVPVYLQKTYWWAYLHPNGVRFFERQWLVNCILWGNFARLRDAALSEMGTPITGNTLQVACVYGDLTPKLVNRIAPGAKLHIVDVAPVQLNNLHRKLGGNRANVYLHHQDSTHLTFSDGFFDQVLVFFLLHEQPAGVREQTVAEAIRVVRPGGKAIFVDYHGPSKANPFRYIMIPILKTLEPFAMDTWDNEISAWIPPEFNIQNIRKETFFGGLYQKTVITKAT